MLERVYDDDNVKVNYPFHLNDYRYEKRQWRKTNRILINVTALVNKIIQLIPHCCRVYDYAVIVKKGWFQINSIFRA